MGELVNKFDFLDDVAGNTTHHLGQVVGMERLLWIQPKRNILIAFRVLAEGFKLFDSPSFKLISETGVGAPEQANIRHLI